MTHYLPTSVIRTSRRKSPWRRKVTESTARMTNTLAGLPTEARSRKHGRAGLPPEALGQLQTAHLRASTFALRASVDEPRYGEHAAGERTPSASHAHERTTPSWFGGCRERMRV